jgi:hypothetical protein
MTGETPLRLCIRHVPALPVALRARTLPAAPTAALRVGTEGWRARESTAGAAAASGRSIRPTAHRARSPGASSTARRTTAGCAAAR